MIIARNVDKGDLLTQDNRDQAVMPVGKITDDWYIVSGVDVPPAR